MTFLYCFHLNKGWVWFSFLKLGFLKKWSFQKVQYEKVFLKKTECLVKVVKKYFLKKLSVWLALIKVAVWRVNYQKWQCIYKSISSRLGKFLYCLDNQQWHLLFAYPLFLFLFFNQIYSFLIFIFSFPIHFQQFYFSTKNITSTIFFAILSQES